MAAPLRRPSSVRPRVAPRRAATALRHLAPLLAFAAAAFAFGIVVGSRHEPSERRVATRFADGVGARRLRRDARAALRHGAARVLRRFGRAYPRAADVATLAKVRAVRCAPRATA